MSAFSRFPARLQEAIVSRLGWTSLRPVQELAGVAILDGKNAVVLAPTAGGKTEASMFPALASLIEREPDGVGVIYVAPIKALLNNQNERLGTYAEMVGLRRFVWHGDVTDLEKRKFKKEPAEILMTTPESLEVMLDSPRFPVARVFADLRMVVIDEVHAMAGTDRGAHLMSVIERLAPMSKNDVQRIGLSATVGNPVEILAWLRGTSKREGVIIDPPKPKASRDLHVGLYTSVGDLSQQASGRAAGKKSLFFCQSRALTETVADRMRGTGIDVFVHHSSVALDERRAAEERFHQGTNACIVCTSTLELGIDVGDLDHVFQANAPSTVSSFLQRMGRTGRRSGTTANTTFLCEAPEATLQAIALIELARSGWVESVRVSGRCWPVLVHQVLAMTLQLGAVSAERCWEQLSRVRRMFYAIVFFGSRFGEVAELRWSDRTKRAPLDALAVARSYDTKAKTVGRPKSDYVRQGYTRPRPWVPLCEEIVKIQVTMKAKTKSSEKVEGVTVPVTESVTPSGSAQNHYDSDWSRRELNPRPKADPQETLRV